MARILHVVTSLRAEGTPRIVLDWLTSNDHLQGVLALSSEPDDLLADFRETRCWLRIGDAICPGPRKFLEIMRLSRRSIVDFRPDLVVAWPAGFSHWVFLGARAGFSGAKLLSHAGNPPDRKWFGRYVATWLCLSLTALCGGKMVACSQYVQRLYREIPLVPKRLVAFAYNSVRAEGISIRASTARAARAADKVFRVIMVATLESHKDHANLLLAAKILQDRGLQIEVLLVGAGKLESHLKALADKLNVNGTVRFLGARRDIPELLGQSDLFVLSTTAQEGWGVVVVEALAAGLPIVASDLEPLREVLENGKWGVLVQPGNPSALADAIAKAAQRHGQTLDSQPLGVSHARSFSVARMMDSYLGIAFGARRPNDG
jgi:glycosyltransferase involved in cell wall biosynthesis